MQAVHLFCSYQDGLVIAIYLQLELQVIIWIIWIDAITWHMWIIQFILIILVTVIVHHKFISTMSGHHIDGRQGVTLDCWQLGSDKGTGKQKYNTSLFRIIRHLHEYETSPFSLNDFIS